MNKMKKKPEDNPKQLVMKFPAGLANALYVRQHGAPHTQDEIIEGRMKMQLLYRAYEKAKAKYDAMDVWWDVNEIEKHFKSPKWYYAHRKLKKLENEKKQLHKDMFYLLVHFDMNYETFDSGSMYPEDIFENFMSKYQLTHI